MKKITVAVGLITLLVLAACSEYSTSDNKNLVDFLKQYEQGLSVIQQKYPLVKELRELDMDAEKLTVLSRKIITGILIIDQLKDNEEIIEKSRELEKLTLHMQETCRGMSDDNMAESLKKAEQCYLQLSDQIKMNLR